jgi:cob(I)alamin adenosyltransferase
MGNMSIYTRTGDKGETGLANGDRVRKDTPIISFIGHLDEFNAQIGLIISQLKDYNHVDFSTEEDFLQKIQNNLFVIGANVVHAKLPFDDLNEVKLLENYIDELEKSLPKLTNFILPGGSKASSLVHLARTNNRKIETLIFSLNRPDIEIFLPYFNRLSDSLFVMARSINFKLNIDEPIWKS